jgi:pimeloyl-ACP methyl ester carboxylesterase
LEPSRSSTNTIIHKSRGGDKHGEYQVATSAYTYTDTNRIETFTDTGEFRKLNVKMWYPENTETRYPLIVFSHGGISTKSSNESLYHELASNGYVVCSIDHTYHCLSTTDEYGHTTWINDGYMHELFVEDAKSDRQQSYEYYQKWMKIRTGDISFVIDHILQEAENDKTDKVYRLINTARIGVIGHSAGGSAALGIGRMRDDISAVIALESPFMCDITGVEDGEFVFADEAYPVPVLNVYSDSAWSHLAEWPQYAENHALLFDTDAIAFNVHISGVGHFSLTDLALASPLLTRIFNGQKSTTDPRYCLRMINKICLEFFNCYLKGKGEFTPCGTSQTSYPACPLFCNSLSSMICHHTIHKHFLLHYPYPALVSPLRDLGGFGVRSKRLVHRVITQYLSNQASVGAAN